MKLLLVLFILSSTLFSWQKQIIIGSYAVESNGKRALNTLNTQIENDLQLQAFTKKHSLRTINTEISNYTVVSINAFESYQSLLNTMNVLKVYYGDAFVLPYPTESIRNKEMLGDIEEKAIQEIEREEAENKIDALKRAELKKLLEEEALKTEVLDREEITFVEPTHEEVNLEATAGKEIAVVESETVNASIDITKRDNKQAQEYIFYLLGFALLALIAAGVTVLKISSNKKKTQGKDE